MTTAKAFLEKVLPWKAAAPVFFNLHVTKTGTNGGIYWDSRAYQFLDAMTKDLAWMQARWTDLRDVYVCMSAQAKADAEKAGKNNYKYRKAQRHSDDAMWFKSFYVDVDVKAKGGYATTQEAEKAVQNFLHATGLPAPTIVVQTGSGGFHIHWTLDKPIDKATWAPLARALAVAIQQNGLLADTQVTVDAARILRVPETKNFKHDPPKPVTATYIASHDYPLPVIAQALANYVGKLPITQPGKTTSLFEDGTPSRAATAEGGELMSGIEYDHVIIKIDDVAKAGCGFIETTLKTGGKDHIEPVWRESLRVAAFCEDARATAHRLSHQHPGYTKDDTNAKFDEVAKNAERVGWPQCATIARAGAHDCRTCPLLVQNKSPLNFAVPAQPTAPINMSTVVTDILPDGYRRAQDGRIWVRKTQEDGTVKEFLVLNYPILRGWMQSDPWMLNFEVITHVGSKPRKVSLATDAHDDRRATSKILGANGIVMNQKEAQLTQAFIVAWVQKLQSRKEAIVPATSFGWLNAEGKLEGFVFAGKVWTPTGSRAAAVPDPVLVRNHEPLGALSVWQDAAKLVIDQDRPVLNAVLAAAFAGPLIRFTGHNGVLLSVYSPESGTNKTTAMKIAASVWGHPIRTSHMLKDSENSTLNKMGHIKSLPVFWDELKGDQMMKKFVDIVYPLASGREKTRLTSTITQREPGEWETMLVSACNDSLIDYVNEGAKSSNAGLARLFEAKVEAPSGATPGRFTSGMPDRLLAELNDNYGVAGLVYAEFLGKNHGRIKKDLAALQDALYAEYGRVDLERFWIAAIAALLLGAKYASELGLCTIPYDPLKAFLTKTLINMRAHVTDNVNDMASPTAILEIFNAFVTEMLPRNTLYTDIIPQGAGQPIVKVEPVTNMLHLDSIRMQIALRDKKLRIGVTYLKEWARAKHYPTSTLVDGLKEKLKAIQLKATVGAGTRYSGAQQQVLDFDLNHPSLNDLLAGK